MKRKGKKARHNAPPPPPRRTLNVLIEAIRHSKGLKVPLLTKLYNFLSQLSFDLSDCDSTCSTKLDIGLQNFGVTASSDDLHGLCAALFEELDKRFQRLFSALFNVSPFSPSEQSQLLSSLCATSKEFTLLLRCCLVVITLPQLDQKLVVDKGNLLLDAFKRLCSLDVIGVERDDLEFKKTVSQECTVNGLTSSVDEDFVAFFSFVKPSESCLPLLSVIFEAFVDEFLVHRSLRENMMMVDCLSSSDMLFVNHSRHGDVRSAMELMSCHFSLTFSSGQVCESLLNRLSWHHKKDGKVPELGLRHCVPFLLDSTFSSTPEILRTHLVLLASESIGIPTDCMSTPPDVRLMSYYLSAFERSVMLYTRHMHPSDTCVLDRDPLTVSVPGSPARQENLQLPFDLFIRPTTRRNVDQLLLKLEKYWHSWPKTIDLQKKADLVEISLSYMEENQGILDDLCKDHTLSFLQALIIRASEDVTDSASFEKVHERLPHMFLTASMMKSMNGSLLQALWCLRNSGQTGRGKFLEDSSGCREYEFIVGVISCFQKFESHLPRHQLLLDFDQGSETKHKESKQMLLHFSCFLSLAFRHKFEFLVKGCIFTLMTVMNLIIFEDGHLDSVKPLLLSLSRNEVQTRTPVIRQSSHTVASEFQKIQTSVSSGGPFPRYSQNLQTENIDDEASCMRMEEETCSGKMYLNCVFEGTEKPSDIDDLSDFIECKPGKDYSAWLKGREKYRKWKVEKMGVLRWEKRRKTFQSIKSLK